MGKIWTEEQAQQWISDNYPGGKFIKFQRYKEGNQKRTDAIVTCVECGEEFTRDWYGHRNSGNGRCNKCSSRNVGSSKRIWTDDKLKDFVEAYSKCKFIKSERRKNKYNTTLYLTLQCGEDGCDNIFDIQWDSFRDKKSCKMCPHCTDVIRRNTKRAHHADKNNALEKCPDIAKVWDYNKNKYGPEHYSAGSTKSAWFICDKENCKHEWETSISSVVHSILNGNNGCKECLTKYKYTTEDFIEKLHNLHPHIHLTSEFKSLSADASFYCDVCDNEWTVVAGNLIGYGTKKATGCAVCSGKRLGPPPKYINSIWADPFLKEEWAKYFDEEFMKTHSTQSSEYVNIPCPDCGKIKHTKISNLYHRGFRCSCNSKTSYPNRFVYSVLNQLNIDYEPEYHRDWSDDRRYDIGNEELSFIIENHGPQHYEQSNFINLGGRTLKEEQENDAYKYRLAKENGFQHYIVLDCRKSEIQWIKNSIINSELPHLLHFIESDINWYLADREAVKNIVKEVCEAWEKEQSYDYSIVADEFNLSTSTVQDYLVIGAKHGWCSYSPNWWNRSVYCFQFDKEWLRTVDASRETGVNESDILYCCKKINGYAGHHPETGEELIWCFPEEKETYTPRINRARKSVTCLDTMKEYKSATAAGKDLHISPGNICANCRGATTKC